MSSRNEKLAKSAVNTVYKTGKYKTPNRTPNVINDAWTIAQLAHLKAKRSGAGPTLNQVMNAVVHHPKSQSYAWIYNVKK
jgi:hypothetical protein